MTLAFFCLLGVVFLIIQWLGRDVRGGFTYALDTDVLSVESPLMRLAIPYTAIEEARLERACPQGRTVELVCPTTAQASFGPSVRLTIHSGLCPSTVVYLTPAHPLRWLRQLEERRRIAHS